MNKQVEFVNLEIFVNTRLHEAGEPFMNWPEFSHLMDFTKGADLRDKAGDFQGGKPRLMRILKHVNEWQAINRKHWRSPMWRFT